MNEDTSKEGLTPIKHRQGYFGDHHVEGEWFEDQSGERSWLMKLVSSHASGSYWVAAEEFRSALKNIDLSGKAHIAIDGLVTNLDPEVKQLLLNAIQEWEREQEVRDLR